MPEEWINLTQAAALAGITLSAMSRRVSRGQHQGETKQVDGQVLVRRQDVKGDGGRGRPRKEGTPFLEQRGSYFRWRRLCPADLKAALGIECWTYNFEKDTPEEVLKAASEGLAKQTDDLIETTRAKLRSIAAHNDRVRANAVVRA